VLSSRTKIILKNDEIWRCYGKKYKHYFLGCYAVWSGRNILHAIMSQTTVIFNFEVKIRKLRCDTTPILNYINPLNPEFIPICYLLALLAHHFLHISRIMVKSLTLRLLMSYIYGAHILDVSRSQKTTHHSR